jgi:hypothetical protein
MTGLEKEVKAASEIGTKKIEAASLLSIQI